jgi:hypothetical protein
MTGLLTVTATALVLTTAAVHAQAINFAGMLADTGCNSKYSDDKKADLFASKYQNREMIVTGEIASLNKGDVGLKVLRDTFTYDIAITLRDAKAAYDLEKGQRVTVQFTVDSAGGCILPYEGKNGIIQ